MTTTELYETAGRPPVQVVTRCIACDSADLRSILDLGDQPLANNLVAAGGSTQADPVYPLGIQSCQNCHLVQLKQLVKPELMFASYLYVPSASTTWLSHCDQLASDVAVRAGLRAGDLVVEIGSNDGALLEAFRRHDDVRILGVDPAENIAAAANSRNIPTLNRFFGVAAAEEVRQVYGAAAAVVSTNVLTHVPDPVDMLRGVAACLKPDAIYVNESPSLAELIEHNEFDTIYHEHMSYFSLHALQNLFALAGLRLIDALPQSIHGGTLRVTGVLQANERPVSPRLTELLNQERAGAVLDSDKLSAFGRRATANAAHLKSLIRELRAGGSRVAAYGATAKGNTLLGFAGLTRDDIAYIVDRNPLKQGLFTPTLHIPVVSPDVLSADPPDVLLLLAWNLADEIRAQLRWFSERGGRFLLPVPDPRLVA